MDKRKLENLLKKEEGPKLDFKQSLDIYGDNGKKELIKDVCAIANSPGGRGYIIIGVEDKTKNIIGIEAEDIAEERIQQIISSRCDPPIPIALEIVEYKNKKLAIINIYDGDQKPYQVRDNGAFYIRRGSTTDTMRKQELVSSFQANMALNSELCSIVKSNIGALDMEIVKKYFSIQGLDINDSNKIMLLEGSSIINRDRETNEYCLTLGGLLVFSKINNLFISHNLIKIINKINRDYEEVIFINGHLISMVDKAEEILKEILPKEYPVYAVLEGVKNAILYRDYTVFTKEIEVILDKNSIAVISPGILIRGRDANCPNYIKRNMWIYEKLITLDDKKRFNNTGRGFIKMKKAFKKYGKVMFVNSPLQNSFKVIYPGIKNIKND